MGALLAFAALASWTFADLFTKHALSKQSLWFVSFWAQLLGGAGLLLLGLLLGRIHAIPIESWPWVALFSVINIFGMFFFYKSVQQKGVALSLPIIYSWSLPTIVLSMIFLNQYPSPLQWFGVGTIIIGLFCISLDRKNKHWIDRGTFFAFFSMLIWGVFYFLVSGPSELYGEWWLSGSLKVGTAVLSLPFLFHEQKGLVFKRDKIFWVVGLIGLFDAFGLVALSTALQLSSAAVATGITSTAPAAIALLGVFLFKEKVNRQQGFGIAATVGGILLLVI